MSEFNPSAVIPKEIKDFYRVLNDTHMKIVLKLPALTQISHLESHLQEGIPYISLAGFEIDEKAALFALEEVCQVITRYRPQLRSEIEQAFAVLGSSGPALREVLAGFLWQDAGFIKAFSEKSGLPADILSLVLFNTLKPLVSQLAREQRSEFPLEVWGRNTCPICGWRPAVSSRKADNTGRRLHCSLCETSWQFKNIKCPHCLNEDHKTLPYFTVEDDEIYNVQGCQKCGCYIKSVNESKIAVMNTAFLTDADTLYLDILAAREGFGNESDIASGQELN